MLKFETVITEFNFCFLVIWSNPINYHSVSINRGAGHGEDFFVPQMGET